MHVFSFAKLCVLVNPVSVVGQQTAGHSAVQSDDLLQKNCLPVIVLALQWPACRVVRKHRNTHKKYGNNINKMKTRKQIREILKNI